MNLENTKFREEEIRVLEGLFRRIIAYNRVNYSDNSLLSQKLFGVNGERQSNIKAIVAGLIKSSLKRQCSVEYLMDLAFFDNSLPEDVASRLKSNALTEQVLRDCNQGFIAYKPKRYRNYSFK